MRSTSIAAGLAMVTVAFIAIAGGEPTWGENCHPTPRMSVEQSQAIKRSMLPPGHQMAEFELDHKIPKCLGGNDDRSNLQLQDWPTARLKDYGPGGEAETCRLVHSGVMSCAEGRELMRTWGRR